MVGNVTHICILLDLIFFCKVTIHYLNWLKNRDLHFVLVVMVMLPTVFLFCLLKLNSTAEYLLFPYWISFKNVCAFVYVPVYLHGD